MKRRAVLKTSLLTGGALLLGCASENREDPAVGDPQQAGVTPSQGGLEASGTHSTPFDLDARTVVLNDGKVMPIIGLGTWTLNDDAAENSVYHALEDGYRLIDTARYYGNAAGVQAGVRRAIDDGIVTREDVFITTKIGP